MIKTFDAKTLEQNSKELVKSLKDTGFAIISNHDIDHGLMTYFYEQWASFFKLPVQIKEQFLHTKENQSGYFPFKSEKAKDSKLFDLKEFYHYYEGYTEDPTGGITRNVGQQLNELGIFILSQIYNGLPEDIKTQLSEPLPDMIVDSRKTLFRVLHYPPIDAADGAVRAAAHEDINLITLLPVATAPGLEVQDVMGNWISVGGNPGEIVINVGDMLQEATKGYLKSTSHRVVNGDGKDSRYSAPLFIHPRDEVVLSERYTANQYLVERLKQLGLIK